MDMREMNRIKILFFATLRERAGVKSLELDVPSDMTVEELKEKLIADYPNLKESMHAVLITVNREYAFEEAIIPPNAEIGMFPPVSGG
jgi:molybdopterin synthase catalytic subunit